MSGEVLPRALRATAGPRDYTLGSSGSFFDTLAGAGEDPAGLPGDRSARTAASIAFAELKLSFLHALEPVPGADWLRNLVLMAEEPVDLWLLRASAFEALSGNHPEYRSRRQLLRRGLDSVFPEVEPDSGFAVL